MIPERYGPPTYALMRIAFALIYLNYGLQKFGLFGGIDGHGGTAPFLSWPFGVAGVIETVAGILILIGLWTRPAALGASGEMAVAYFWVHQFHGIAIGQPKAQPLSRTAGRQRCCSASGFSILQHRGAGIWSVDAMRAAGPTAAARV